MGNLCKRDCHISRLLVNAAAAFVIKDQWARAKGDQSRNTRPCQNNYIYKCLLNPCLAFLKSPDKTPALGKMHDFPGSQKNKFESGPEEQQKTTTTMLEDGILLKF